MSENVTFLDRSSYQTEEQSYISVMDMKNSPGLTTSLPPPVVPASAMLNYFRITYIIAGIIGIVGNGFAGTIVFLHKPLRKNLHNLFIINQCLIDFVLSLMLVPTMLATVGFSYAACYFWQTRIFFIGLYSSFVYSVVALSIERYLEVVHPIKHKMNVTQNRIVVVLAIIWLMGTLFKMVVYFPAVQISNGVCKVGIYSSKASGQVAGVAVFLVEMVIPLFIIILSHIQMARSLRHRVHFLNPTIIVLTGPINQSFHARVRRNIALTLALIVSCLVACNVLKQTLLLLNFLGVYLVDATSIIYNVAQILASSSCCIYPYIYLYSHNEFKRGARLLLFSKMAKIFPVRANVNNGENRIRLEYTSRQISNKSDGVNIQKEV